jgi:hypothetical protein
MRQCKGRKVEPATLVEKGCLERKRGKRRKASEDPCRQSGVSPVGRTAVFPLADENKVLAKHSKTHFRRLRYPGEAHAVRRYVSEAELHWSCIPTPPERHCFPWGDTAMTVQDRLTLGVHLARQRFPALLGEIETMFGRDDNFRDMCEELAPLTSAILKGTPDDRVLADWISARERLTDEIADALSRANLIALNPRSPPQYWRTPGRFARANSKRRSGLTSGQTGKDYA